MPRRLAALALTMATLWVAVPAIIWGPFGLAFSGITGLAALSFALLGFATRETWRLRSGRALLVGLAALLAPALAWGQATQIPKSVGQLVDPAAAGGARF